LNEEKYRELKVRNKASNAIAQTQMTSKEDTCKLINEEIRIRIGMHLPC
jgi:hypothetical protein